jgi:hypothetical protein
MERNFQPSGCAAAYNSKCGNVETLSRVLMLRDAIREREKNKSMAARDTLMCRCNGPIKHVMFLMPFRGGQNGLLRL